MPRRLRWTTAVTTATTFALGACASGHGSHPTEVTLPNPKAAPTLAEAPPRRALAPSFSIWPAPKMLVDEEAARAIALSSCPAAVRHDSYVLRVGCRACPPFKPNASDGKIVEDPSDFWPIEAIYKGAFTRASADERAVVFEGCEPHAGNYGGTLLVEATGPEASEGSGTFRTLHYFSGLRPTACQPVRKPDGRDLLVCTHVDVHQSLASQSIFAVDFATATEDNPFQGGSNIMTATNNAGLLCTGVPPSGIREVNVPSIRLVDRNGDGVLDLVVAIRHRFTPYSLGLVAWIEKECAKQNLDENPTVAQKGEFKDYELVFLFGQGAFHATPGTAAALATITPG